MQPLKEQFFYPGFYRQLSQALARIAPDINANKFYQACIRNLPGMELKQRVQHTAEVCRRFLPASYPDALKYLYAYAETLNENSFSYMFMPDFVARYGAHDFKRSMQALKDFTQYSSSELAIRVFLQDDLDRTLSIIKKWTVNENAHIRRLASEGTRPRLPWAVRVKTLLEKPSHCFPILQDLKADNEKYVQKSVANHLNDISKDHPEIMLQLVKSWDNTNQSTQWIIRHAARTLVKKGNRQALALFGAGRKPQINLRKFALNTSRLQLGDNLEFELELVSCAKKEQQLIIDYRIHYVKASGHTSPKVFKLKTATLKPGQPLTLRKKHPVKNFTTRKHYSGRHLIELLINGRSINSLPFQLDATRAR